MYTIEQSLDGILLKLKENWNNSGGRKFLVCEDVLTEFGFPPDYRKHEFFIRLIDKLVNDGYAEVIDLLPLQVATKITLYQQNTIITVEGFYFINAGGYVAKARRDETSRELRDSRDKRLSNGTVWLAVGTFLIVAWELLKTFVFEHHYWCDF